MNTNTEQNLHAADFASTSQPADVSMLRVDFEELYRRHLCRHSQFGLNVLHLLAVLGVYFCIFGIVAAMIPETVSFDRWVLLSICLMPYFAILIFNVPVRVLLPTIFVVAGLVYVNLLVPALPWYVYLVGAVVMHQFQQLSHRFYKKELDMTTFNKKYKKGKHLFVLLSLYELPILLRYLLFGRADWVR